MKKRGSTVILILIFVVGLAIFAYPKVANKWNSYHSSRAIMAYNEVISGMTDEEYAQLFAEAEAYNRNILSRSNPYTPSDEELAEYETLLNVAGNGVMGYIEIPFINVSLPVYHGTAESVLQIAVGHLDWTSLPVGGASTHAVLSGHRGLPSAELFTNLDRLAEGDRFMLYILNDVLTYEIDQIHIVLPEEIGDLQISADKDYCTLVTCTPYGINTHRMLVRGHRVDTEYEHNVRVTSDAIQIEPVLVAPIIALPLLFAVLGLMFASDRRQWEEKQENEKENEKKL